MERIAEGNPGALSILQMLDVTPEFIDLLYDFGPYGSDLWMLYKDWCGEDWPTFMQILGAIMQASRPEVFLSLQKEAQIRLAEREVEKFAQEWERYGYENFG